MTSATTNSELPTTRYHCDEKRGCLPATLFLKILRRLTGLPGATRTLKCRVTLAHEGLLNTPIQEARQYAALYEEILER